MKNLDVRNPWDNKVFDTIKTESEKEIEAKLSAAYDIIKKKRIISIYKRIEILENLKDLIKKNYDKLVLQASKEGGKIISDSSVEITRGIDGVNSCIETLRTEAGQVIPMNLNKASANRLAFTQKEPIGLVLAISAFNHPFNLIIHQAIPAIAVGCPVIVKPAEDTPLSCRALIELLYESGLPCEYCQMIIPESIEIATKVVSDSRVAFLSFIGSSKVGWYLKTKLSPGARCALEHGGMAPLFLERDANIDNAVKSIKRAGFYHAGQVCVSVQKVFVQKNILKEFQENLVDSVNKIIVGNQLDKNTDVGPLIRPREVDRIDECVQSSIKNGSTLLTGGKKFSETCYHPTLLLNPSDQDLVSKKEVFGPVVCIYEYESLDEAIKRVNEYDVAFQTGIFTNDLDKCLKFYKNIDASAVFHNEHTAFRVDWMPFTGLKTSGHGVGGIKYTMDDMQIEKMLVLKS